MLTRHKLLFALLSVCLNSALAAAQEPPAAAQPERATVTVAASAERVRFAAPERVARLRLEVLSAGGGLVFEADSRGSVFDWALADAQGARLTDGTYLCVVTVKDLAGRLSQRLALLEVAGDRVEARPAAASDLTPGQAREVGPVEGGSASVVGESEPTAATLLAHDGTDGRLVTTAGALSFRGGDFFTGRDKELMRLSADGSLDLVGTVTARGGIRFADGTLLTTAAGRPARAGKSSGGKSDDDAATPAAAGTGTLNQLAKWAENGGAGTLTNSAVTEVGGDVGIGTTSPAHRLHVAGGKALFQHTGTASLFIVDRTDGKIASLGAGGLSATFAYDSSGIFKIESNSRSNITQGIFGVDRGATTRLAIDTAGNVGIGTEAPTAKLHVAGNGLLTGNLTVSGTLSGNGSGLTNLNASNITAGTLNPSLLDFGYENGKFLRSNGTTWVVSTLQPSDIPAGSRDYIQSNPVEQQAGGFNISGDGTAGGRLTAGGLTVDTSTLHVDAANDMVGVGTAAPASVLHVVGAQPPTVSTGHGTPAAEVLQVVGAKGGSTTDSGKDGGNGANVLIRAGDGGNSGFRGFDGAGGSITLQPGEGGSGWGGGGATGNVLLAPTVGDVGIGTATPGARLDVAGSIKLTGAGSGLVFPDGTTQTTAAPSGGMKGTVPYWTGATTLGNSSIIQAPNGNVGINTTLPGARLDVAGDVIASGGLNVDTDTLHVNATNNKVGIGTTAPLGRLQVVTTADTNPLNVSAWDNRHFVIGGPASGGGIGFSYDQTNNVGYISSLSPNVLWRNLVLQSGGGNVGIGTTSPQAKLQVGGGHAYVSSPGQGLILKSPNGSVCRLLSIDNSGNLVTSAVTCP